ncbi:ferrochelatase [Wolbachia endosymbiont of Howardula sp.]|uniref:ferrochelatase n=1 Tax=Wolbachia endosymbiont of Howardula sp. TaxID=2916816 RepID=UPI00217E5CA9|nr:ferrochelatase [Wolbachia endosymbiont of Howardula sp.]UWI83289.1 ferrochelatase [Wolbachia endosymbiont of Howardula sp.]
MNKAIVLFNLGGPNSLETVRPFLFNLFYDKRIINVPNPIRFFLAKFISKKREKIAQEIYKHIGGKSPILENTQMQAQALEASLNSIIFNSPKIHDNCMIKSQDQLKVFICMRYWHPFAEEVVQNVKKFIPDEIVLLPLYPQYSTTTTLSSVEDWYIQAKKYDLKCDTKIIHHYYDNKYFITAHANLVAQYYQLASTSNKKPRVLFSAHGLPISIIKKGDPYASQIKSTAELIVKKLAIENLDWSVCYQSKIGPIKWLEPSTESELLRVKSDNIPVVLCPISFVSEHSETLVELDIEYKAIIKDGYYFRVPALGTDDLFIACLTDLYVQRISSHDE